MTGEKGIHMRHVERDAFKHRSLANLQFEVGATHVHLSELQWGAGLLYVEGFETESTSDYDNYLGSALLLSPQAIQELRNWCDAVLVQCVEDSCQSRGKVGGA